MSAVEKILSLFLILSLVIIHTEAHPRKRVCVIGAGRSGLAAIKKVADQIGKFEPIAFERNSDVGGLWIYRDDPVKDEHGMEAHSGIYKNLQTLTTKQSMIYQDYRPFSGGDVNGYVSHETFLEYMRNFTDHFQLRKYIQLDTYVTKVEPTNGQQSSWILKKRNLNTNIADEIICDAVIVCNGRYSKPNIPVIPGLNENFRGQVLHSRNYRKPEDFADRVVIVLGAGASGLGIAHDLSTTAKTVYLSHRGIYLDTMPRNVEVVRNVVKFEGDQFILEDDSTITADAIIFCTGYVYDFPFLDKSSGVKFSDGKSLSPLTNRFVNRVHPTMAFIGMSDDNAYTDIQYSEMDYFLKTLQKQMN